jgi:hypothetical protein
MKYQLQRAFRDNWGNLNMDYILEIIRGFKIVLRGSLTKQFPKDIFSMNFSSILLFLYLTYVGIPQDIDRLAVSSKNLIYPLYMAFLNKLHM